MNIIGIVASPRKGGNTEALTRIALSEIQKEGIETKLVSLVGKEIKACDTCGFCHNTNK